MGVGVIPSGRIPAGFFAPRKDQGGMVSLLSSQWTTQTQDPVTRRWTITIDATASNTPILCGAKLWPLRDINGDVVPAGEEWIVPPLYLDVITPPAEASDMWIGVAIVDGADFTARYVGTGYHYDAAGGPDRRRFTDTIDPPVDVIPLANAARLLTDFVAGPNTVSGVDVSRMGWTPLDSSGVALAATGVISVASTFTGSPYFALIAGSSTGGVATAVVEAAYPPQVPMPVGYGVR
jgi:hypothetical protein